MCDGIGLFLGLNVTGLRCHSVRKKKRQNLKKLLLLQCMENIQLGINTTQFVRGN